MKVQLTDEQIQGVFDRADLNKDKKLSYEEYERLVLKGAALYKSPLWPWMRLVRLLSERIGTSKSDARSWGLLG